MKKAAACLIALACAALLPKAQLRAQTQSPTMRAWAILESNRDENSTEKRVQAVRVMALLPGDPRAIEFAQTGLTDDKPEIRAASATSLGQMHSTSSIPKLRALLDDKEPEVVLAAANALIALKDPAAYEVFYELLTGERKPNKGMIASQMKTLKDPKKMAEMGFEEGIGFIPFASIGYGAFKVLRTDDVSPVRAAAARILVNDPDPNSARALVRATSDKSWIVRGAALEAIARRADPKLLDTVVPALLDDNLAVRCTASAAVIRLTALKHRAARNRPRAH